VTNAFALIRYADGTTLEFGPDTRAARLFEENGKRIDLAQGTLRAEVAKQPAGRPLAILTPHGEARVVGTTFRLTVRNVTRLEVEEGKVQLKGINGKTVDVPAGHLAVASGAETIVRAVTSLLAHWKLDEGNGRTAIDATGLGNDAALKDKTEWTAGKTGGAVECRKAGFYVPEFRVPGPSPAAYTVALWIYHDALDNWQDVYFSMPGLSIVREGNLDLGRIRVSFQTTPPSENLALDAIVRPKQWIHLALTWDGQTARLYRNGKSVGAGKAKGTMEPPRGMEVSVGAEVDGKIDDVRLYRRALSAPEVAQIMNGGEVR